MAGGVCGNEKRVAKTAHSPETRIKRAVGGISLPLQNICASLQSIFPSLQMIPLRHYFIFEPLQSIAKGEKCVFCVFAKPIVVQFNALISAAEGRIHSAFCSLLTQTGDETMRLSQKYVDNRAELTSIVNYITEVPMPVLVKSQSLHLTFDATEQTPEGVNRVSLPRHCRVAREIAVMAQGTEPTEGDFHAIDTIRHSRFIIVFAAAEIGMSVYLRIVYETTAGRGPLSPQLRAVII